jgi:hypothetical protein
MTAGWLCDGSDGRMMTTMAAWWQLLLHDGSNDHVTAAMAKC